MLQMQSVILPLPTSELVYAGHDTQPDPAVTFKYVPASHSEHVPDPFSALNLPRGHAEQAIPSMAASNPASQMQSVMAVLPSPETVFAGQLKHTVPPVLF
eukprot:247640-Rhodomonas_salina.1